MKDLGTEGIAGLTAPFIDAWAIFGARGQNATDEALARLGQGESLGPLNGYHKAMMLDLGGRLDAAVAALGEAMPGNGPAPVRIVQADASILARHGERPKAIAAVREQMADGRELPVLVDMLTTLEAGGSPAPPFTDAAGRHGGRAARGRRGPASGAWQLARDRLRAPRDVPETRSRRSRRS